MRQPKPVIRTSKVVDWDAEFSTILTQPAEYLTASGHKVELRRLQIEYFLLGILEGHPDFFRDFVLERVYEEVSIVIKEPPEGVIPRYIIRALLHLYPSERTVCWFNDELVNLEDQIVENVSSIDWGKETAGDEPPSYDDY